MAAREVHFRVVVGRSKSTFQSGEFGPQQCESSCATEDKDGFAAVELNLVVGFIRFPGILRFKRAQTVFKQSDFHLIQFQGHWPPR